MKKLSFVSAIFSVLLAGLLLPLLFSCKKEDPKVIPTVKVASVTNITTTSATSGGEITSDGGAEVTARGVCWSVNQNPTTADNKTSDGSGTGSFTSVISGLSSGKAYYLKAYAINEIGTAYSSQVTFNALALIPDLTTASVSAIATTTATSGGNISSDGGASVTARGVCWSLSVSPTTALTTKTSDGIGTREFTGSLTGLTANTTYYVRAYAVNSVGTAYGTQVSFTTSAEASTVPGAPTIGTATAGNAQATVTFTAPGSNGGSAITGYTVTSNPGNITATGTASPLTVTGLTNGTAYTFTVVATNAIGNSLASAASNSVTPSVPATVSDIDGNTYNTVTIGTQVWMAENLKTTKYNDNSTIPPVTDNTAWAAATTGAYSDYSNDPANSTTYGRLYNWYAVDNNAATKVASNGGKNVCPTSWHVPTDAEWTTLENYLIANGYNYDGTTTGNKIAKSMASTSGWTAYATVGTVGNDQASNNRSGFTALPGGFRSTNGTYYTIGYSGYWWSSTELSAAAAWYRDVGYYLTNVYSYYNNKRNGFSVRCVRDF
ncbi:MAG: FISUMP domain-containing protein [Bacteroidota bacterium]